MPKYVIAMGACACSGGAGKKGQRLAVAIKIQGTSSGSEGQAAGGIHGGGEGISQNEIPVAVWVAPSGGRAASAGFFLLVSADVAAMAPGTRTGAAHPILSSYNFV